jgi:hypothetical protein
VCEFVVTVDRGHHEQLARELRRRLRQLGWSADRLATQSGHAPATVRKMLDPANRREHRSEIMADVSRAVGWAPEAIDELLVRGTSPVVADTLPAAVRGDQGREMLGRLAGRLETDDFELAVELVRTLVDVRARQRE